jgi:glycosyltransferase involved in cell wall biosynthesis
MKVQVITPWYPDAASVYLGVFVEQQVHALRAQGVEVDVEVPHLYPARRGPIPTHLIDAIRQLAERDPYAMFRSAGATTWIPSPVPARSGYAGRSDAFRMGLSLKREYLESTADVVHAHLAVPTASALLDLETRPLVVTEHQSTLDLVLAEPRARELYRRVIDEAAAFMVVSTHLRDRLMEEFGSGVGERIDVMPNIVDLSDISFRSDHDRAMRHWVFVGALIAKKGTRLLVESFAAFRRTAEPEATLTLVGDGDERAWVESFARRERISHAITILGAKPRSEIGSHLDRADVMVHMSPAETFGVAALEAIGAGLPVVSLAHGGAVGAWAEIEAIAGSLLPLDSKPTEVSSAVAALASNPAHLNPQAARDFVVERYSAETVSTRLAAIYEQVRR